jgi:Tfp pilus assembly protein PilO
MKLKGFLSKLSKRERVIVSFTTIFLLVVLMDRLVYQPILHGFERLNQEIQAEESRLIKNLGYLASREHIMAEHKRYADYFARAGSDEEETSSLLSEVEGLARESELFVTNMKPQPVKALDFAKKYSVEVEIKGGMVQIIQFFHGVYRSNHLLSNQQLRLTKDKSSGLVKGYLSITKTLLL